MNTAFDDMEGQRPRLTYFSATGGAEIAFRHNSKGLTTTEKAGPLR